MDAKKIIPIVIGVITKPGISGDLVMTQKRLVSNPEYDPLYHDTWETVGETLEAGEDYLSALVRGIKEECGQEVSREALMAQYRQLTLNSCRGDCVHGFEPVCLVQSVGEPQLWAGPAFEVRVDRDFEPDYSQGDGEAGDHRWWRPQELISAMEVNFEHFALFHIPALRNVCNRIFAREE